MSFRFEPAPGSPVWDRKRYEIFLDAVGQAYPNVEEMSRRAVQLAASRAGAHPRVKQIVEQILAIRAITDDGLRVVQLMPDQLAVNYVRGDAEPYPGFSVLLDEAIRHCQRYIECYRPLGVLEAALHYVDIVDVPLPPDRCIQSDDYFTLTFEAPEEAFGGFVALEVKAVMAPPGSKEPVELIFTSEPSRSEDPHRRFQLEWHTAARTGSRMDDTSLRANLQVAHDRLEKCFRSAFTPKGWALFESDEQP